MISIGFSYRKNSIFSYLIRCVEQTPFSHVYIRKQSKYGEYVYQASGLAVNFINIDRFKETNTIVKEYEMDIDPNYHDSLISFFVRHAGARYSFLGLVKIAVKLIAKRMGLSIKISGDGNNTFVCSELAALLCKEVFRLKIIGDLDYLTPKDLDVILVNYFKATKDELF